MRGSHRRWRYGLILGLAGLIAIPVTAAAVAAPQRNEHGSVGADHRTEDSRRPADRLFMGAPGRSVDGLPQAGAVELRTADEPKDEPTLLAAPEPQKGAEFGAAATYTALNGKRTPYFLIVGAPGLTVDGKSDAGGVYVFERSPEIRFRGLITQDHPNIPGQAQEGARFGAAIGARTVKQDPDGGDSDRLLVVPVGAPGLDVGDADSAGGVFDLVLSEYIGGEEVRGLLHTLDAPGSPREPKSGDRLGTTIHNGYFWGAPGATIDGQKSAGMVVRDTSSERNAAEPYQLFYQGMKGKDGEPAGKSEAGDHFGAAMGDTEERDIYVGVPEEDLEGKQDAGRMARIVFSYGPNGEEVWELDGSLNQDGQDRKGKPIPGNVEAGNRFGASITSYGHFPWADNYDGLKSVMVGVPGADPGGVIDAGRVVGFHGAPSVTLKTLGAGTEASAEFGSMVYSQSADNADSHLFIGAPGGNDGGGSVAYGLQQGGTRDVTWEQWELSDGQPGDNYGGGLLSHEAH